MWSFFRLLPIIQSQRVFVRPDSTLNSFKDLKGKIIGVTQYGSGGDTFFAPRCARSASKNPK